MLKIKLVPHAAIPRMTGRVEVVQINTQRLQSRKFLCEAAGIVDALVLQEAVFDVRVFLSSVHYQSE